MAKKSVKKGGSTVTTAKKKVVVPTVSKKKTAQQSASRTAEPLLFGRTNYMYMAIGVGLIFLGMLMMMGGSQPDPNTWDPSIIYSKRITILGPILYIIWSDC